RTNDSESVRARMKRSLLTSTRPRAGTLFRESKYSLTDSLAFSKTDDNSGGPSAALMTHSKGKKFDQNQHVIPLPCFRAPALIKWGLPRSSNIHQHLEQISQMSKGFLLPGLFRQQEVRDSRQSVAGQRPDEGPC